MLKAVCLAVLMAVASPVAMADALQDAVDNSHRTKANVARDPYRHPAETLRFFGVEPDSRVVEIWPGSGWYSEVLGPYLSSQGQLIAAHFEPDSEIDYFRRSRAAFEQRVSSETELFSGVTVATFFPPAGGLPAEAGSVDYVLTFRNVHNWMKAGFAQQAFDQFAAMLRPGGVLGVVEHRAKPGTSIEAMIKSGYVTEAEVIRMASAAGLELHSKSEVNANPKDSADHPNGVWTLPPRLRADEARKAHYLSIGESDRMTLKFIKPL